MLKEFREFILRGNLVDLAVAVVLGTAFGAVVAAFVKDLVTPLIAAIGGQPDFSALTFTINGSEFLYGDFINALLAFVIIAAVVFFFVIKPVNALMARRKVEPAADVADARVPALPERHPDRRHALRVLHVRRAPGRARRVTRARPRCLVDQWSTRRRSRAMRALKQGCKDGRPVGVAELPRRRRRGVRRRHDARAAPQPRGDRRGRLVDRPARPGGRGRADGHRSPAAGVDARHRAAPARCERAGRRHAARLGAVVRAALRAQRRRRLRLPRSRARPDRRDDAAGADRRRLRAARGGRRGRRSRPSPASRSRASTRRSPRSSCSSSSASVALALRPAWLGDRLARWAARRGVAVAGPLRGRTLWQLVAIDLAGWAFTAAGLALFAHGLIGDAAPGAFLLLGAFGLSWIAGVLLPLLPAGLGPRDAVLVVGLAGVIGTAAAASLAIALRVVSFASELVAVAIAELASFALARRARGGCVVYSPCGRRRLHPLPRDRRSAHDRRRADVQRARGAAAVRRALRGHRPRPAHRRRQLPRRHRRARRRARGERPWMHVMHRAEKDGLGMAYRAGFARCLAERLRGRSARWTATSRTRRRSSPEMRRVLIERDAGLVLGSRYLPGGGTDGWSRTRLAMSRVGCHASRLALGLPFSDLSGGFKLWRADALAAIDMDELLSAGYAFQVETTQLAHLGGTRIEEVPFVFSERVAGDVEDDAQDLPRGHPRHVRPAPPPPPPPPRRTARRPCSLRRQAPVAQWIERPPPEREVRGSNPLGRAVSAWR